MNYFYNALLIVYNSLKPVKISFEINYTSANFKTLTFIQWYLTFSIIIYNNLSILIYATAERYKS